MAKISKEEYEMLKSLGDNWKWIARDSSGDHGGNLFAYSERPTKEYDVGGWVLGAGIRSIANRFFQFILWEDGEPYSIAELIEEYEDESEETEVKRNLKEAILGIEVTQFDGQKADLEELVNPRQLEEIIGDWMPEVLSQEWIDSSSVYIRSDGVTEEYVHVDDLKKLIVPKQEEVDQAYKAGYETGKEHARTPAKGAVRKEVSREDHDPVHRPQHYMQGHIETIDKIKLLLTPEEYLGYLKGNVIKYDRAPFKGNMEQDYDKQKVYYDWALEQMEDDPK